MCVVRPVQPQHAAAARLQSQQLHRPNAITAFHETNPRTYDTNKYPAPHWIYDYDVTGQVRPQWMGGQRVIAASIIIVVVLVVSAIQDAATPWSLKAASGWLLVQILV